MNYYRIVTSTLVIILTSTYVLPIARAFAADISVQNISTTNVGSIVVPCEKEKKAILDANKALGEANAAAEAGQIASLELIDNLSGLLTSLQALLDDTEHDNSKKIAELQKQIEAVRQKMNDQDAKNKELDEQVKKAKKVVADALKAYNDCMKKKNNVAIEGDGTTPLDPITSVN